MSLMLAGSLASSEDGIYAEVITVGGIVDPSVESPVAIFSIQPTAEAITYELAVVCSSFGLILMGQKLNQL